jgi:hypothetical protein
MHKARMKARAMEVYPHWPEAYKAADNIKTCSRCGCCANPRRWMKKIEERLTLNEVRFILDAKEQEDEYRG